ncbi:bifunctional DNA primase/polymerase [Streptomyces sp. AM 4-1-1]|uniref:bifunctional DNA primase/polymerase n=1 Tax=Streptomyces sp. AM 4-1-1 TaxID=3028710 RepID=UPI0031B9AC9C
MTHTIRRRKRPGNRSGTGSRPSREPCDPTPHTDPHSGAPGEETTPPPSRGLFPPARGCHPEGRRLRGSAGRLGWKVDTRAWGRHVVATDSVVTAGRTKSSTRWTRSPSHVAL